MYINTFLAHEKFLRSLSFFSGVRSKTPDFKMSRCQNVPVSTGQKPEKSGKWPMFRARIQWSADPHRN